MGILLTPQRSANGCCFNCTLMPSWAVRIRSRNASVTDQR